MQGGLGGLGELQGQYHGEQGQVIRTVVPPLASNGSQKGVESFRTLHNLIGVRRAIAHELAVLELCESNTRVLLELDGHFLESVPCLHKSMLESFSVATYGQVPGLYINDSQVEVSLIVSSGLRILRRQVQCPTTICQSHKHTMKTSRSWLGL